MPFWIKAIENAILIYLYDLSLYGSSTQKFKDVCFLMNQCAYMKTTVNAMLQKAYQMETADYKLGAHVASSVQEAFYDYCQCTDV